MSIPIIDLSSPDRQGLAAQLRTCCCEHGFFYLVDGASVHEFSGIYGDYILNKVAKVFPQLTRDLL